MLENVETHKKIKILNIISNYKMDRDNLWKKQINEKSGKIYFVNTITGELFETSTSIHEKDSYIKIQTIDGQVQIPEDALVVL